jgi:hypothetical protein
VRLNGTESGIVESGDLDLGTGGAAGTVRRYSLQKSRARKDRTRAIPHRRPFAKSSEKGILIAGRGFNRVRVLVVVRGGRRKLKARLGWVLGIDFLYLQRRVL